MKKKEAAPIRLLAFDPGIEKFGYAVFNGSGMLLESRQMKYPKVSVQKKRLTMERNEKLDFVYKLFKSLLWKYKIDVAVTEKPIRYYNSIVTISELTAALRLACMHGRKGTLVPTYQISPSSVHSFIVPKRKGRPKGGMKLLVQSTIKKMYGRRFWEDEADAIGIGLTFFNQLSNG